MKIIDIKDSMFTSEYFKFDDYKTSSSYEDEYYSDEDINESILAIYALEKEIHDKMMERLAALKTPIKHKKIYRPFQKL